jgi:hypothetical protein
MKMIGKIFNISPGKPGFLMKNTMKTYYLFLAVLFLISCTPGENKTATGNKASEQALSGSKLEAKSVMNGKLSVLLPSGFTLMGLEMLKAKYPIEGHRPTEVYTNEEGTINIAFNHTQNKCSINELANYKQVFERQFNQPGIEFLKSELKQINGIDFIVMEFITPAVDSRIYNLMFTTSLENRLMMGTFNCTINHLEEWKPLAGEIINSIKVQ